MDAFPAPTEHEECCVLVDWMNQRRLDFVHVPNEGIRHVRNATKLKRIGLRAGCPDYLIFTPPPGLPDARGVAIEMKRASKRSTTTNHQREFLDMLSDNGWVTRVCHGADEAISWLEEIGYR